VDLRIVSIPRLVSAVGALLLLPGCGGDDAPPGPTGRVEVGRIERIVVATGTVEPATEVVVRPRIAGIVEKIHVDDGDDVELGQPLVEIERELLASQAREARAALREAEVERRYASIDLERADELQRGGAVSSQQQDGARARFERGEAGVARARARLDTLETELSYATVVAPMAGRVLAVAVEEGSAVSPVTAVTGGTELLTLAATDDLHLEGLVDENEVARVSLGQPARIRTEAYGDRTFAGRVEDIAPLGQRIQNVTYFEVEIEITDPDRQLLRPRMSGDAEIVAEVVENALIIPETALRYRGSQIYVKTLATPGDGRAEDKDVEIGIVDGSRVQVLKGLSEGEEVLLQ
jgi:RND family efflux transporter MFP subunit